VRVLTTGGVSPDEAERLASRWFPGEMTRVAAARGGFGGCPPWIVRDARGGRHVLKAFPPGTPRDRAEWVHRFVGHLRAAGVVELPPHRPLPVGGTITADRAGRLWEMAAFAAGSPAERPTEPQVAAAVRLLARVHGAAVTFPDSPPDRGPSRAIADRVSGAARLLERPWQRLLASAAPAEGGGEAAVARQRLAVAVRALQDTPLDPPLARLAGLDPPPFFRQAVLRDPWYAHVLFEQEGSTTIVGLIDPHAAGVDTPATDLARLLGSWLPAGPHAATWLAAAIAAYEEVRPLPEVERRLVPFLAASGILLGLDNWFRWVLEEGRQFGGGEAVARRLDRLVEALPTALRVLVESAGRSGFDR